MTSLWTCAHLAGRLFCLCHLSLHHLYLRSTKDQFLDQRIKTDQKCAWGSRWNSVTPTVVIIVVCVFCLQWVIFISVVVAAAIFIIIIIFGFFSLNSSLLLLILYPGDIKISILKKKKALKMYSFEQITMLLMHLLIAELIQTQSPHLSDQSVWFFSSCSWCQTNIFMKEKKKF